MQLRFGNVCLRFAFCTARVTNSDLRLFVIHRTIIASLVLELVLTTVSVVGNRKYLEIVRFRSELFCDGCYTLYECEPTDTGSGFRITKTYLHAIQYELKIVLFCATDTFVGTQKAYDISDNRKMYNGHNVTFTTRFRQFTNRAVINDTQYLIICGKNSIVMYR